MARTLPIVLALLIPPLVAVSGPVSADEPTYSATLLGGYRGGGRLTEREDDQRRDVDGSGSLALALNWRPVPDRHYELFYSRQRTGLEGAGFDLGVEYLHLGGLLSSPQGAFSAYFGGGFGATRIDPRISGAGSDLRPSMSLAAGLMISLLRRLEVRLEARGYLTFTGGRRGIVCFSGPDDAFCQFHYDGEVLTQLEALGGLTWRF